MNRPLTDDEKALYERQLARREEEERYLRFQAIYLRLMLDEGLALNYEKTRREHEAKLAGVQSDRAVNHENQAGLKEHIANGVPETREEKTEGEQDE